MKRYRKILNAALPWMMYFAISAFFVFVAGLMEGCASAKQMPTEQRTTKDSVVYTYKTVYRDSVRMRDSTVIRYATKIKDSVVVKVDKATGQVIGKDSWHWSDRDKSSERFADVRKTMSKADSVSSEVVKKDSSTVVRKTENKATEAKKTPYWRTWWLGLVAGIVLSICFKYRKSILKIFAKVV